MLIDAQTIYKPCTFCAAFLSFLLVLCFFNYFCALLPININRHFFTEKANKIFNQAIADYHIGRRRFIDTPINNPYEDGSIENRLYLKCWIDTVQWHFEDIIRDPQIDPAEALILKRRIDKSNQDRTDLVE